MVQGLELFSCAPLCPDYPTISFRMARCKGCNGLQDLMCHVHCSRAILARYHRPRARAGCVKKRFKLELQGFFVTTLQMRNLDGRPFPCLGVASATPTLSRLKIA